LEDVDYSQVHMLIDICYPNLSAMIYIDPVLQLSEITYMYYDQN